MNKGSLLEVTVGDRSMVWPPELKTFRGLWLYTSVEQNKPTDVKALPSTFQVSHREAASTFAGPLSLPCQPSPTVLGPYLVGIPLQCLPAL